LDVEPWPWPVKVYTLGRFAVLHDDRPLRFAGKVQKKPLSLLKAVIALGSPGVPEERLMDALWSDAEGDAARRSLTSAVFRLRRMLGHEAAVLRGGGEVALNPASCWVDVWAVDRLLGRPAEVKAAYRRCAEMLAERLGVRPSPATEAVLGAVSVAANR